MGWQPPQRLPCKGSWRRSRLRGALPLCAGSVLQNPAEPRSVLRRGRCLHRPVDLAPAQTLRADENHRPPRRRGMRRSAASGDPERYLRGKAPHPSVCACGASTSPCRGGCMGRQPPQRLPCKGSWRRSRLRGCIAALRRECPAKSGRALPQAAQEAVLRNRHPPAMPARHLGTAARKPMLPVPAAAKKSPAMRRVGHGRGEGGSKTRPRQAGRAAGRPALQRHAAVFQAAQVGALAEILVIQ